MGGGLIMGRFIPTDTLSQKLLIEVLTEMVRFELEGQEGMVQANEPKKSNPTRRHNQPNKKRGTQSRVSRYPKNIKSSRQRIHF